MELDWFASRLDRVAWKGLEKWRLVRTLMCIKRGLHGGRSSDACARVASVERPTRTVMTTRPSLSLEDHIVTCILQSNQYLGARLCQVSWYRTSGKREGYKQSRASSHWNYFERKRECHDWWWLPLVCGGCCTSLRYFADSGKISAVGEFGSRNRKDNLLFPFLSSRLFRVSTSSLLDRCRTIFSLPL